MKCFLLSLLLFVAQYLSAQELSGFVGGWRMDNNCQLTDISTSSPSHGVLVDVAPTTNRDNTPQSALSFSQPTSYISLGAIDKFKLANDKSISFWLKPTPTGSDRTGSIFVYGTGIIIRYREQSSNLQLVIIFGNDTYLTRNLTPNQWQHITLTFQKDFSATRSKLVYYENFVLATEVERNKTTHDFTNAVAMIGPADQNTLTNGYQGSLDDLKIYNRTLTGTEVQNIALPVTFQFFKAKKTGKSVLLSWKTQLEENVSHFELQRSNDGTRFSKLTNISAGNYMYQAIDVSGITGTTWYRLKIIDIDGENSFSNVIHVNNEEESSAIRLFPNPVSNSIQLVGASGQVTILNNSGMILKQKQLSTTNTLNVSDLKPGLYYLIYFDGDKRLSSKFTKL